MQRQLCVGRRKYAFIDEQLTESHAVRKVDAEHIKRDTPDWRFGFEFRTGPSEVFVPVVIAGVEQSDDFVGFPLGVNTSDITLLLIIASKARPSEIQQNGEAAVLLRDDVVPMKHERVEIFRHPAVFAAFSGSLPNLEVKHSYARRV